MVNFGDINPWNSAAGAFQKPVAEMSDPAATAFSDQNNEIQPKTSNFLTERISTPEPAFAPPTSVRMRLECRVHVPQSSQRHSSVSGAEGIDPRRLSDRQTDQNRSRRFYEDALLLGRSPAAGARILLVGGATVT